MTNNADTWAKVLKEVWVPAIEKENAKRWEMFAAFEGVSVAKLQERQAIARKRARRIDRRIRGRILRISRRLVLTWRTLLHGAPQDCDY